MEHRHRIERISLLQNEIRDLERRILATVVSDNWSVQPKPRNGDDPKKRSERVQSERG